MTLSDLWKLA